VRLIERAEEVDGLRVDDPDRVAYLTQTTLAVDEVEGVVAALRRRFPRLAAPASDDICYATTNRQAAVRAVAREADLTLVVGSANSSNSRRLVEVAERERCPAHLVDDAGQVDPAWLAGVRTVALTAGASAPEALVSQVVDALAGLGPVQVTERQAIHESVQFTLPKEVG
jgi:4-hydroxy-3-methylbut-2-enyl diphosphate reductase